MKNKILIVEDNQEYADIMEKFLSEEKFEVSIAHVAVEALELLKRSDFNLIMVDLDLGAINGFQLAELIRIDNSHTPIMILTGSPNDEDETKALELGIDEYVRKSVSFSILLGRIHHTINHTGNKKEKATVLKSFAENIEINTLSRDVYKDKQLVQLTTLEYELLQFFIKHKNQALTREVLLENVWKIDSDITAAADMRIVDTSVKNIRKKLGIHSIFTIRGIGYKWDE